MARRRCCGGGGSGTLTVMRSRSHWNRRAIAVEIVTSDEPDADVPIEAAEAWKAVGLVNEWVRHAETKAAGVLATSGVVGGVLFNLVKDQTKLGWVVKIAGPTCGALAFTAAMLAVCALWPRLRSKEPPTSVLYFDHIARRFPKKGDGPNYVAALSVVLANPGELMTQLGQQVWANARVARRKFKFAGWAMVALIFSTLALAVVALRLALLSMKVWT